jgi:hypothetical protein
VKCARWRKARSRWGLQWRLGRQSFRECSIPQRSIVNERFGVELSHVVVILLDNGTSHEAC